MYDNQDILATHEYVAKRKMIGDFSLAAKMLEKTTDAVRMAWVRKEGESYMKVLSTMKRIIDHRESLLATKQE